MSEPEQLVRLWAHELLRVFHDRLVDDNDRSWISDMIQNKVCGGGRGGGAAPGVDPGLDFGGWGCMVWILVLGSRWLGVCVLDVRT